MAIAALFVAIFAFRYLSYTGFPNDHFVNLSRAQQMLLGAWPVRDFVDPGLPLMYAVSAAGVKAFGHNLFGEALIVFGAFAAAGAITFGAARAAAGSALVAVVAVLLQAAIYPRSYSYPKFLLYAAAIALCWQYLDRPTAGRRIGLAALVSVAFLFRHDHGLFIGLAALVTVLLAEARLQKAAAVRAGVFAAIILALLSPWLLLVGGTVGFPAYLGSAIEFSRAEAALTRLTAWPAFHVDPRQGLWQPAPVEAPEHPTIHVRWVPGLTDDQRAQHEQALGLEMIQLHEGRTWRYHVERSAQRADAIREDPAVEDTDGLERLRVGWTERATGLLSPLRGGPGKGVPIGQNTEAFLFYIVLALPIAAIAAAIWRRGAAAPMPRAAARLVIVAILAICVDATFLRDPLRERLPDVMVPATVLAAWLAAAAWRGVRASSFAVRIPVRAAVATLACIFAMSVAVVGQTAEQFNRIGPLTPRGLMARTSDVTQALRETYTTSLTPSATSRALVPAFAYLDQCTRPDDRFSYIGYEPETYFFAHRGFAGGQVVFLGEYYSAPGEQEQTIARFRAERVPVILFPDSNAPDFRRRFPALASYIDTNYVAAGAIDLPGDRRADVLIDHRLTPTGVYADSGWPCFREHAD